MRSRALDVLKSARVSRRTDDERVAERVVGDDDPSASPDQRRVRAALSEIPPEQRTILELAYFEGLSCSDIATRLTIPIGTVKSRLAAALSKLRNTLGVGRAPA
jgi:RNA polymerase sigma-70 factor (ECF subfamily)